MRQLLTMVGSDLRQRLRDRSVIVFAIVVPLGLMLVFNLVFSSTGRDLDTMRVAVSAPQDDQFAQMLTATLEGQDLVDVTLNTAPADEIAGEVDEGEADLGLVIPDDFTEQVRSGAAPDVVVHQGADVAMETTVLTGMLDGVLNRLTAGTQTMTAAAALGAGDAALDALDRSVAEGMPVQVAWIPGTAATEQLTGGATVVAGQAGLFLLFTVGFGILALVYEREWGTLARLVSMPMPTWYVLAAKALVSVVLGVVATSVLLTAGELLFADVDFGSRLAVLTLVVLVVVATTSVMLVIARVARTAEQAGIAQTIVAMTLGMAGGAFFPIRAEGMLATLLQLNPVYAMVRGLGITSGGGGILDLAPLLPSLLAFTAAMLVLALVIPGRKELL